MCVQCAVAWAQSQLDACSWLPQVSLAVIVLITSVHKNQTTATESLPSRPFDT